MQGNSSQALGDPIVLRIEKNLIGFPKTNYMLLITGADPGFQVKEGTLKIWGYFV